MPRGVPANVPHAAQLSEREEDQRPLADTCPASARKSVEPRVDYALGGPAFVVSSANGKVAKTSASRSVPCVRNSRSVKASV